MRHILLSFAAGTILVIFSLAHSSSAIGDDAKNSTISETKLLKTTKTTTEDSNSRTSLDTSPSKATKDGVLPETWLSAYNDVISKIEEATNNPPLPITGLVDPAHFLAIGSGLFSDDFFASVQDLINKNREFDIRGVPLISLKLLSRAESLLGMSKKPGANQSIQLANELSPESSAVFMGMSRFVELLGHLKCLSLFSLGLKNMTTEPVAFVNLLCFCLLVMASSAIISLLVVCCVQIVVNLDHILVTFSAVFPSSLNKNVICALLAFVTILPLTNGLIFTVIIWSLLLALFLPNRRLFHILSSIVSMISLIVFSAVLNLSDIDWKELTALENINKGLVAPEYVHELGKSSKNEVLQQMHRATLAHVLLNFNQIGAAEDILLGTSEASAPYPEIRQTNLVNQAALLLAKQDVQGAQNTLREAERAGDSSFELYFNLSQSSLANVEMAEHRKYTSLARERDPARFGDFEMHKDSGRGWVSKPLPEIILYQYLFDLMFTTPNTSKPEISARQIMIAQTLSPFDSLGSIYIFCSIELIIYISITLFVESRGLAQRRKLLKERQLSVVWSFLPMGYQLASLRPIQAYLGFATIFSMLWIFGQVSEGTGAYIRHSRSLGWNQPFGWAALAIYAFFMLLGMWQWSSDLKRRKIRSTK